jgi:hypothetical protein
MSRPAIALMDGSVGGLVDEFYPDISRKLFHSITGMSSRDRNKP